jgi:hypothetical protein
VRDRGPCLRQDARTLPAATSRQHLQLARAASQGRNWARIVSTVLFGLTRAHRPIRPLTWLIGAAAAWLLRRPTPTALFKPLGFARAPALI